MKARTSFGAPPHGTPAKLMIALRMAFSMRSVVAQDYRVRQGLNKRKCKPLSSNLILK